MAHTTTLTVSHSHYFVRMLIPLSKKTKIAETTETPEITEVDVPEELDFSEIEGSEFLIPIAELYPSARLRFQKTLRSLEIDFEHLDEDKLADLLEYVDEHCVRNRDGWHELNTGENAVERVLILVFAYVTELAKKA